MNLDATLHLLPREGAASPLYIYLHGAGSNPLAMTPVAERFARAYPQAAHLIPEGFEPSDSEPEGRQWFGTLGVDESSRPQAVANALPALTDLIRAAQAHFHVTPVATALVGFAQGGMLALGAAQSCPGLVGRVVVIASSYACLPDAAPESVIHLVHGKEDPLVPARHSIEAATRLIALGGDVTADIVPGIGHEPHPELIDRALDHLQSFLPRRVWEEVLAEAPLIATRADSRALDRPIPAPPANDPV